VNSRAPHTSLVFLADFTCRLSTAPSASAYFFRHFGWVDLLAGLPFPQLKILRIFRLARVYRLLRTVGIRAIGRTLVRDRASSALYVLLLMGILALQFRSLTMLAIEQNADGASITTASDALWYTISTVGYGDQCAVTNVRRLFAVVIIIVGVGIFGTFTGYLATVFLSPKATDAEAEAAIVSDASATVPTEGHTASVEELRRRVEESEDKARRNQTAARVSPTIRPAMSRDGQDSSAHW
jgi:hypothetical protein